MKENLYRKTREEYNKKNAIQLTISRAAEKLPISIATLERIETNKAIPDAGTVFEMSKLYDAPVLRKKYCAEFCVIGKCDHEYVAPKTLFESGYGLLNANKILDQFKEELFDVLSDGKVDKDEIIRLNALIPKIKGVQKLLEDIEVEIEKHTLIQDINK